MTASQGTSEQCLDGQTDKLSKQGPATRGNWMPAPVEKALSDTLEDESHLRLLTGDHEE